MLGPKLITIEGFTVSHHSYDQMALDIKLAQIYLGMQFDGVLSTSQVAKNFIGTGFAAPDGVMAPAPVIVLINLSVMTDNVTSNLQTEPLYYYCHWKFY